MRFYDLEGRILLEEGYRQPDAGGAAQADHLGTADGELIQRYDCGKPADGRSVRHGRELLEALREVRLKDWVLAQPKGLDTLVGDSGGKLSGGQRQKLGIARALLCRAEYIIFDEATSSVDTDSEQEIWSCIDDLAQTRTLIVISHRLSTIRNADRIYVLENGRISQRGTHETLMREAGAVPPSGRRTGQSGADRRGGMRRA